MPQLIITRKYLGVIVLCGLMSTAIGQNSDAMIKISGDPIKRDYRIIFSAKEAVKCEVTLESIDGNSIFQEDFGTVPAFVKKYSLTDAPLGVYVWEIKYGTKTYSEEFRIESEKKLIKESIKTEVDDLLNLKITVEPYNTLPLTIFLYNGSGDQLDFIFWETSIKEREKLINLSQYDAYDIRLEILQQGDVAHEEKYQTY
ncbi:MAG: hypothetical protein ACI8QD_001082 [Cyclobacteriaceae bacterium]|jgi:hypothetical protein